MVGSAADEVTHADFKNLVVGPLAAASSDSYTTSQDPINIGASIIRMGFLLTSSLKGSIWIYSKVLWYRGLNN